MVRDRATKGYHSYRRLHWKFPKSNFCRLKVWYQQFNSVIKFSNLNILHGDSYTLLHHVMGGIDQYKGAWVYPKGGMGSVSEAIAKCAIDHGAHLITNTVS